MGSGKSESFQLICLFLASPLTRIREEMGEIEIEIDLFVVPLIYTFIYSLADSSMHPDQGLNLQPWLIRKILHPPETWLGPEEPSEV